MSEENIAVTQLTSPPLLVNNHHSSAKGSWKLFGSHLPSKEVVFFVQVLVVVIVLITCVVNLSLESGDQNLWKYLLCSIIGYILPNPSLEKRHG